MRYEGEVDEKGLPHGMGTSHSERCVYRGRWSHGVRSGFGYELDLRGRIVHCGGFAADTYDGDGTHFAFDVFDETRMVKTTGRWKRGSLHGKAYEYDERDALIFEGLFREGLRHGTGRIYDKGTLRSIRTFKEGRPTKETAYHENGHIKSEGALDDEGLLTGVVSEYDDRGRLTYHGPFLRGRRHGEYGTEYDGELNVIHAGSWFQGRKCEIYETEERAASVAGGKRRIVCTTPITPSSR